MLAFLFSFSGRLRRLQYFLGSIGVAFGAAFLLIAVFAIEFATGHWALALLLLGLGLIVAAPVVMWIGLSMQARRLRDMGWNPIYVLPSYFFIVVADSLVARAQPHLAVHGYHTQTAFGLIVSASMTLVLWFWPSVSDDGRLDESVLQPVLQVFDAPPLPRPALAGMPPSRPIRKEFGRRGR